MTNGKLIHQSINIKLSGTVPWNFWKTFNSVKQVGDHKEKPLELVKIPFIFFQQARSINITRKLVDWNRNNLSFPPPLPYPPTEQPYRPYHQSVCDSLKMAQGGV